MTLDERLKATTTNLERTGRNIEQLRKLVQIDAENIRALSRIAEINERRLSR